MASPIRKAEAYSKAQQPTLLAESSNGPPLPCGLRTIRVSRPAAHLSACVVDAIDLLIPFVQGRNPHRRPFLVGYCIWIKQRNDNLSINGRLLCTIPLGLIPTY